MKLSEWRKARGLSQQQVADLLKIGQSRVHRIENGQVMPRPPTVIAIIEMTGGAVTANDFYDLPENQADPSLSGPAP